MSPYLEQLKSVWFFVHNVLMVGSPGSGKTLLARAMPGIWPELTVEESLEVTRIYSVADALLSLQIPIQCQFLKPLVLGSGNNFIL